MNIKFNILNINIEINIEILKYLKYWTMKYWNTWNNCYLLLELWNIVTWTMKYCHLLLELWNMLLELWTMKYELEICY